METGKMNDRIRIFEPKAERNLTSLDDYELAGSVWANVRAVTTRNQMRSGIDVQSGQLTILIRYVTGLSDDCLIEWNGRFYGIDNLAADRKKGEIQLGCSHSGFNENQRITT